MTRNQREDVQRYLRHEKKERPDYGTLMSCLLEEHKRQQDFDAEIIRHPFAFKLNPTDGYNVFFTANHVKDLQGHLDRYELFMRAYNANQPTPLTTEWRVPPLEHEQDYLALGFNPFTPAYSVEPNDPTDTEHSGSEDDPEIEVVS